MPTSLNRVLMPGRILQRHVGGNTTYARSIATGLRAVGVEVDELAYSGRPEITLVQESVAGLRRRADGTVLHYAADTGPLFRTRTPSIVTVHGVASRWIRTARTESQERRWRMRVRRALASTDRVITVSNSSRDDICDVFGVDPARVRVIRHGIDRPVGGDGERPPEKLSDPHEPYVLYLGNIEPRKNLVPLVRAMDLPALRGFKLVVAGRPAWNFEESMRAIAASSRVDYLGFVSDGERSWLMRHAALFAFPSLYEGFGFPVLEAQALGVPVICSDRGSLAEVAGPARRFASLDAEGIAAGLVEALGDEAWRSLSATAGPAWSALFSWEESVRAHLEVYREVVA